MFAIVGVIAVVIGLGVIVDENYNNSRPNSEVKTEIINKT